MFYLSPVWFSHWWVFTLLGVGAAILGMVCGLIAMIGLQVMVTSDRVRNVPLVIERERINFHA